MLFQKCIEQAHIRTEKELDQYLLEIDNNSYGINPCLTRFRLSLAQRTELLGNLVVCVKFCHQFLRWVIIPIGGLWNCKKIHKNLCKPFGTVFEISRQ